MSEAVHDILSDWRLPLWLTLSIASTALVYLRGWVAIRRTRRAQFTTLRLLSFLSGLGVLWLAIGSPMDGFADALLSAHMVEHLLLMSAVPPLLLMGLPVVPLLRGLPKILRRWIAGPLLRLSFLRRLGHWLVSPIMAWLAMNVTFLAWHFPVPYCFALEDEGWHVVEHLCFLGTSILFWWCIVRPWPASTHLRNWGILIYLIAADVVNTVLSGFLSFCGKPVYRCYVDRPNSFNVLPLEDQVLGAAIMWVIGSVAFLVPAMLVTVRLLRPARLT
ncbi:MAG: Cytochrome c oxidase caa3-type, assembly factor CtaG-related protein [Edaphobacter sp.]|nr:Cytochrome c oxidase caa3-type, assembly factor CtaG-related protein [Edaphobacter sp.]